MALPISSSPLPPDVAVQGWAAITVRVAWTLLTLRVNLRPEVLRDARDHVLFHLDPTTPLTRAEDLASHLTRGFVARARRQTLPDPWPQDIDMPLSPRWRRAIDEAAPPLSKAIFQHHYGYGRTLDGLESALGRDRIALEEGRGGLREIVRRVAMDDGLPFDTWPHERIDRLLQRLAAFSIHDSPPLDEVAEGCHREWVNQCPRCDRAWRLVKSNILTSEDLVPPLLGARPSGRVEVLAVHLHPDGKRHRALLIKEIGGHTQPIDDDVLLVDGDPASLAMETLALAAEVGTPARDHVRAVRLAGAGRWSRHGLLGPLADRARLQLRAQPWGLVDGHGELPEMLPPPPSARGAWAVVGGIGLLATLALVLALRPAPPAVDHPLRTAFTAARGGVWTWFDTDEAAQVTLIRKVGPEVDVLLASQSAADKAAWATGDGAYRLHTMADGVLVATSSSPLQNLDELMQTSAEHPDPLNDLAARIRAQQPGADVAVFSR